MAWTVYMILCEDDSLYTGITTDLDRRFKEHQEKPAGAKYFNGRKALRVVYVENAASRSEASTREAAIKKLSRAAKLQLVAQVSNFPAELLPKRILRR